MKLPVQEPGLLEIILKVSDWHIASVCSENFSPTLGSSVGKQTSQHSIGLQHDQCVDRDQEHCPIKTLKPNLRFSTDVRGAVSAADMVFVTVNTPSKVNTVLLLYS
jgi:hypothetical protein